MNAYIDMPKNKEDKKDKNITPRSYTTKKDFLATIVGLENYIPGDPSTKDLVIATTSGTTEGSPIMIVRKIAKEIRDFWSQCHGSNLVPFTHPVAGLGHVNCVGFFQHGSSRSLKNTQLLFLDKKDFESPYLGKVIAEYKPTIIPFIPQSYLNSLINKLRSQSAESALQSIREFTLDSEMVSKKFMKKFRKVMPHAVWRIEYSLTETSSMTMSCHHLSEKYKGAGMEFSVFHPLGPFCTIEIADQGRDGIGEIVVTTNNITRYRTGDRGKLINEKCPCGASTTLILYGRDNYDIVYCVGAIFLISELDRVFTQLKEYVEDFYVEVEELDEGGQTVGKVRFFLIPTEKLLKRPNPKRFIVKNIAASLYITPTQTLADIMRKGIILNPSVHFVKHLRAGKEGDTNSRSGSKKIRLKKII